MIALQYDSLGTNIGKSLNKRDRFFVLEQAEVGAQIEAKDALLRTVEALEAANTKGDAERDELQEGLGSMQEMVTEQQDEMKVSHTPALHYTTHGSTAPHQTLHRTALLGQLGLAERVHNALPHLSFPCYLLAKLFATATPWRRAR